MCQVTSSRCENLILLHSYLQILNVINPKNSWESLRCKYQTDTKEKWKLEKTREKWKLNSEKNGLKISKP